jgi:hypothetical protein
MPLVPVSATALAHFWASSCCEPWFSQLVRLDPSFREAAARCRLSTNNIALHYPKPRRRYPFLDLVTVIILS